MPVRTHLPLSAAGLAAILSTALLIAAPAVAGDWQFVAVYTADLLRNVEGGLQRQTRYLDNLDLTADRQFQVGDEEAEVFVYGLYNNAATFSDTTVGDLQVVSNIDSGEHFRLFEAWYRQTFADRRGAFKLGLIDLNTEFDAIEAAGLFVNSSHGIGIDFSQSGENGPSIFPTTSLALTLAFGVSDDWNLRLGAFDAVPGDPNRPRRMTMSLNDGVLAVAEVEYVGFEHSRLVLGGWYYSDDSPRLLDAGASTAHNQGTYLFAERALARESGSDEQGLDAWLRFGGARTSVNQTGRYLGAGLVYTGLLPGRDADQLGIAVASAFNGDTFRRVRRAADAPVDRAEIDVELTYRMPIGDWLTIQPDVQYIVNPGAVGELDNALVLGLRFEIGREF